ncbi:MAG TPA: DUF5995 family protein [Thermoleophilaceae bacterium]
MRFWICVAVLCTLAFGGYAATAGGSSHPANVHWESFLPALPSSSSAQPGPVPHCRKATSRCIDEQVKRMKRLQREMGCDHRGVFATTYLELTRQYRDDLKAGMKNQLQDLKYLYREVAVFANVYFETFKRFKRGEDVPEAWRIAFETARSGEVNGAQDMLLGINAHVQNDMPFVIAALGIRARDGSSRKPDHDVVNDVLDRAYERVVAEVSARYDPFVSTTNAPWNPGDDVAGLEMVRVWRENVWRNAERLVNAASDEERQRISEDIKARASDWARGIATFQTPGDRQRRDMYCAAHLAG